MHAYTKAGKRYTALSNAYRRECTKGSTVGVPVCSDYGKMFDPCDKLKKRSMVGCGLIGMVVRVD